MTTDKKTTTATKTTTRQNKDGRLQAKGIYQAIGRRKNAVARVRLTAKAADKGIVVNDKPLAEYFNYPVWQKAVSAPLEMAGLLKDYGVSVKVVGGGVNGQAEAIRHGITRALLLIDENLRKPLKAAGFVKRDPRVKERKKPGLKSARRAPQWQKR
ncbi:MAG: 30S ribosomal protein S9 [Candidatus Komeilibacteria bacterium]